ncbi:MAG: VTT domain-containing protein [Bacilli bacterium]|nr:VTT domain-containing protein [Bacilli bacterium]
MEILKEIDVVITNMLDNIGFLAPLFASILILVESIIPVLPLSVFITLNFYYFGVIFGFLISWILTCIGCYISFILFRSKIKFSFDNKFIRKNEGKIAKWMGIVNRLKFEQLVIILSIPFTPAFIVNIVAGLSSMSIRKFIYAIVISKIFLVFFWGFVGTTFLESFQNPLNFIKIIIACSLAFLISKIVNKKFNIE